MEKRALIIPGVEIFEVFRESVELTYDIAVYVPDESIDKPRKGWPLYILLDGNATFLTTVEMLRLQSRNTGKTNISPGILVGIGEKNSNPFPPARSFDMTTTAKDELMQEWFKNRRMPIFKSGGADEFQDFIEETVLPLIYQNYHVNRQNKTITGHSLAGLFVLYSYTKKPGLFEKYIIASPSLWWNDEEILETIPREKTMTEVQIYIGGNEPTDMKKKCERLFEKIKPFVKKATYIEFENENHMSVLNRVLAETIRQ